ncbi:hypothetical protein [Jeotgalibacillus campisalis]|uniref:Uncharacterized protein n=1 Tax=Jeotgalibacillus campisalis TaxID=220754 RepID=A0A0C2VII5_9BACL|nr:hypothetical protein [Jeotgalibacillus campisalis]KIL48692.1 hypothetical protein KR50_12770 [Jeotgalibacillus campisalis]
METTASFIVDLLFWTGIAVILFILISIAFYIRLKASASKKKNPAVKK